MATSPESLSAKMAAAGYLPEKPKIKVSGKPRRAIIPVHHEKAGSTEESWVNKSAAELRAELEERPEIKQAKEIADRWRKESKLN